MSDFLIGFLWGFITALCIIPLLIKWFIKKKIRDLTGGLLE